MSKNAASAAAQTIMPVPEAATGWNQIYAANVQKKCNERMHFKKKAVRVKVAGCDKSDKIRWLRSP